MSVNFERTAWRYVPEDRTFNSSNRLFIFNCLFICLPNSPEVNYEVSTRKKADKTNKHAEQANVYHFDTNN
jgi:hypothetical protein